METGTAMPTWDDAGETARPPRAPIAATLAIALLAHALLLATLCACIPAGSLSDATESVRVLGIRVMHAVASAGATAPGHAPLQPVPRPVTRSTNPVAASPAVATAPPAPPIPATADTPPSSPAVDTAAGPAPADPDARAGANVAAAPTSSPAHVDTASYGATPKPPYPALSKRLGEEGQVMLRVRVGSTGTVLNVEVVRGSGYARLDDAARRAVTGWRFVPARENGAGVESTVVVPLTFSLDS